LGEKQLNNEETKDQTRKWCIAVGCSPRSDRSEVAVPMRQCVPVLRERPPTNPQLDGWMEPTNSHSPRKARPEPEAYRVYRLRDVAHVGTGGPGRTAWITWGRLLVSSLLALATAGMIDGWLATTQAHGFFGRTLRPTCGFASCGTRMAAGGLAVDWCRGVLVGGTHAARRLLGLNWRALRLKEHVGLLQWAAPK